MYRVSIFDKNKKHVCSFEKIHTVKYCDVLDDEYVVTGDDLLSHHFPTNVNYQLLADDGNYSVDASVIGTFEVIRVTY